jgi:hypothetical protein
MIDLTQGPLADLRRDLERLSALLELLKILRDFGSSEPPAESGDGEFGREARNVRNRIRALSAEIAVLSGTLLLFIAGRFEHFARTLFEALCDSWADKCEKFDQLPEKMRDALIYRTAAVVQAPTKYGFDQIESIGLLMTLAQNLSAADGLGQVNSRCLSVTETNMTATALAELFKRIGVMNIWQEIAKQAALKTFFALTTDSDCEKTARARLDELMTVRNQIAHPTGNSSFPDLDQVGQFVEFVRVLAQVLADVARVHATAFNRA